MRQARFIAVLVLTVAPMAEGQKQSARGPRQKTINYTGDVQVRVYGNTAVETGRSLMNGQDKGQTVPRATRFTRVWVKQQGRWRLVANHYSSQTTRQ